MVYLFVALGRCFIMLLWPYFFWLYLTGGFKKPRELTWVTTVPLAVCSVSFGLTGRVSLVYDQGRYWTLQFVFGLDCIPDGWTIVEKGSHMSCEVSYRIGLHTRWMYRLWRRLLQEPQLHLWFGRLLIQSHFLMIRKQGISLALKSLRFDLGCSLGCFGVVLEP